MQFNVLGTLNEKPFKKVSVLVLYVKMEKLYVLQLTSSLFIMCCGVNRKVITVAMLSKVTCA